jgi:hypothetical protein
VISKKLAGWKTAGMFERHHVDDDADLQRVAKLREAETLRLQKLDTTDTQTDTSRLRVQPQQPRMAKLTLAR